MKKIMKRSLILAFVVMTMITMAFCVSAADAKYHCEKCGTFVPLVEGEVIPATCDTEGYTELVCKPCKEKGIITLITTTDPIDPLGHLYTELHELVGEADNGYYKHITACTRKVNNNPCHYRKTEEYEDHTPVKYFKVTYVNSFATAATDPNVKYTTLATDYKEEELHTEFVKEGNTAAYKANPDRMADKNWGDYVFVGWEFAPQATLYKAEEQLRYFNGFSVPVKGKTNAEYKLYAIFQGLSVAHEVTFYTERGVHLATISVNHKDVIPSAQVPEKPLKADNVEYKFTFDYWTLLNLIGEFNLNQPIYGKVDLKAHYTEVLKKYQLKYFDRHDKALPNDITDYVNIAGFGTSERLKPDYGFAIKDNPTLYGVEASYFDESFDYKFTGNWLIPERGNAVIEIDYVDLPDDILDYDQTKSYIKVVPQYRKIARIYDLNVFITYEIDGNYHPEEINVQVTDADGSPIGVSTLTEDDIVSGKGTKNPTYKKVFKVRYSPSYRVVATSKNYKGERTPIFVIDGEGYADYHPGGCAIVLSRIPGEPCGCICHGIFKPVWVGILNILYNLFKLEFVCCDDMFANIGDNLAYGPNKS